MNNGAKQIIKDIILKALPRESLGEGAYKEIFAGDACEKLELLFHRLVETNERMNVTAITECSRVALLHFADSITAEKFIPEGSRVIDVGCGGGFPTLPLAIVRPDIKILALDSTAKKLTFVDAVAKELDLKVETLASRAEELACDESYRESFDVAVSRAVARLNILSELCIPFVKVGGSFIAMKGQGGNIELEEAQSGIKKLGCSLERVHSLSLLDSGERMASVPM